MSESPATEVHAVTDTAAVYAMQLPCSCSPGVPGTDTPTWKDPNCPAHGNGMVHPPRPTDDQDRVLPEHLTEREMLVELVNYMRGFTDLMTQLADNQAGSGLMGMLGKMMGITPEMLKRK